MFLAAGEVTHGGRAGHHGRLSARRHGDQFCHAQASARPHRGGPDAERDATPVLDGGTVVGVLSRGPLVAALEQHPPEARVSEVLAPGPVVVADPLEALDLAFRRMLEARQGALPVMSDGQLVGIVTAENVADLMMEQGAVQRRGGEAAPRGDRWPRPHLAARRPSRRRPSEAR